jgi:hypothetical protein
MSTEFATNPNTRSWLRCLLSALALGFALAVAVPGSAGAANIFTLDSSPDSFAGQAVDSAGTGYFAWEHKVSGGPDVTMFCAAARMQLGTCANPIVLPAPPLNSPPYNSTAVSAAFPVLGGGSIVYVVGARFVASDVVVWKSTDGGVTFGPAAQVAQSGAYAGTNPSDVLAAPSGFYLSSHNPGLNFTSVPSTGTGPAAGADLTPTGGLTNIADSTLGLAGGGATGNPVEAFNMLNGSQPRTINFRRYTGPGDPNTTANWAAPAQVTTGTLPSLAGGPKGLFLVSEDSAAGNYTQVNVRKYNGSGFGAPVTLQGDTSGDNAGRMFQTPTSGRLLVAWQGPTRADGASDIRLYVSTDGGVTFTPVGDIAAGTPFYAIGPDSIRVGAADDGQGYVSFLDYGGGNSFLRVADLTPIKVTTPTPTVTPPSSPSRPPAPAPPSMQVAGIIFVGGTILVNASFNTSGSVLAAGQVLNPGVLMPPGPPAHSGSVAKKNAKRCSAGQVLLKSGKRKRCVSTSFGASTTSIPAAGTYAIKLPPNAAALKAHNKGKMLRVKATLTFKPVGGGAPVVTPVTVTVTGKRKR